MTLVSTKYQIPVFTYENVVEEWAILYINLQIRAACVFCFFISFFVFGGIALSHNTKAPSGRAYNVIKRYLRDLTSPYSLRLRKWLSLQNFILCFISIIAHDFPLPCPSLPSIPRVSLPSSGPFPPALFVTTPCTLSDIVGLVPF